MRPFSMLKAAAVVIALASILTAATPAVWGGMIVADFAANMQPNTPKAGWSYLLNPLDVAIGDAAHYQPLRPVPQPFFEYYNVDGSTQIPGDPPGSFAYFGVAFLGDGIGGHAGQGTAQAADGLAHYAIAAFTLSSSGPTSLINGVLTSENIGHIQARVFVNNVDTGLDVGAVDFGSSTFSENLGNLTSGDTIYVAIGPGEVHDYDDQFKLSYQIEQPSIATPEPSSLTLLGLGALGLLGYVRCRRTLGWAKVTFRGSTMRINLRTSGFESLLDCIGARVTPSLTNLVAALVLLSAIEGRAQAGPLVIGGFDTSRGGTDGFNLGSAGAFQSEIENAFPGTRFVTTIVLTPSFLSTINVLMISSVNGAFGPPIAPLSTAEQSALVNFVKHGGGAFILTDNIGFDAGNQSLLNPFGVHATGYAAGNLQATVTNPLASPVTNGPFGEVASYLLGYVGWYDNLGANAQSLATLDVNGHTALAVIDKGVLGPGSGGVVFSSDTAPLFIPNDQILDSNIIAYLTPNTAVPEPGSLTLLGLGLLGFAGYGWRRRRASVA